MPYEVGVAYYREIARGQIRGDTTGRLKIIFHRETREILGVHIIGEGASELLHIGPGAGRRYGEQHPPGRSGAFLHRGPERGFRGVCGCSGATCRTWSK